MKTVQYFAFYPHNLPKITFFAPWSSMDPKNTKSLHFGIFFAVWVKGPDYPEKQKVQIAFVAV